MDLDERNRRICMIVKVHVEVIEEYIVSINPRLNLLDLIDLLDL